MVTPARPNRRVSVEEYLAFDNESPLRHEYVAGVMYAMSGETMRHNRIAGAIYARLLAAAGDGPCRVFINDVKVRVASDRFYYPDVAVVCEPSDDRAYVAEQPCVVVEVTSPSTRRLDRGEKLDAYQAVPSLRAYLIVEQGARLVERHWRDPAGEWRHDTVADDGDVPIPCPATSFTLDDVYRGIELDPVEEPRRSRLRRVREPAPR